MQWCITMQSWDDIRIFLALARAGTSRAAADSLGVNQSTVSRRLARLEQDAGVRLFERLPGGLVLTAAGEELLASAEHIDDAVADLDRRLLGRDTQLRGRVRLSMPDFMVGPTAPILARLGARYPAITIELMVDNGYVDLTHREADLALRLSTSAPDQLVGRRLAPARAAIYGAPAYLDAQPQPLDPTRMDWLGWDEPWRGIPPERWMSANLEPHRVRARVNTNLALCELSAAGLGVAFQLCFTGDADPRLRRVGDPWDFGLSLWLLTHADLRSTARIRALMRGLGDALADQRAQLYG